jgi:hypothetical protein
MTEMVRGYLVAQALEFVRSRCSPAVKDRVDALLSSQFRAGIGGLTPGGWFPRRHMAEVLSALAQATPEDARFEQLVQCGQFINQRTTNEFVALVYGILTPELFVKRVPRFWQREHQGEARCELSPTDGGSGLSRLELVGVEGYDHIGVVWLGWMKGALSQMRSGGVDLTQTGWTPGTPAPRAIHYELRWS